MIIANPIYDVVFKYLLEDMDIARELLSVILGEEIVTLEVKPQERSYEIEEESKIRILRFDFKATIKNRDGALKNVIMELQKAKPSFDIIRFRNYLAQNYASTENVTLPDGKMEKWVLPIISIYFLGFPLDNVNNAAFKINREYRDMITGEVIHKKEDFAEFLTHDCFIIQLPFLENEKRNKLERVLQVFNQDYKLKDEHFMFFQSDDSDGLVNKMATRLSRAAADESMRSQMDFEDEFNRVMQRNLDEKNKIIGLQVIEIKEKNKEIAEKKQEIAAKKQELADRKQEIADKKQEIADKKQELADKKQELADKDKALESEREKVEELLRKIAALEKQNKKTHE